MTEHISQADAVACMGSDEMVDSLTTPPRRFQDYAPDEYFVRGCVTARMTFI
jgi:hypothetical protein